MQAATTAQQALPPEAIVMQMVMGGWVARAICELCRLNIADTLGAKGPMTAAQLNAGGLAVNTGALERVLRACASVGILTEDAAGRLVPSEKAGWRSVETHDKW